MIPLKLIDKARKIAYKESQRYGIPSKQQIVFSCSKGIELSKKLHARTEIVELGTLFMDCALGFAFSEGRMGVHIEMGARKTEKFLSGFPELTESEKDNIIACVREHHGISKFTTLESEIVCNADCYKFVSIAGVMIAVRYTRDMEMGDLIDLLKQKAEEKWAALSLEVCRQELKPEYEIIKLIFDNFKKG